MIKIDKNIPIPPDSRGKSYKYPFEDLQIGDSFVMLSGSRGGCVQNAQRKLGHKYTIRNIGNNKVRVWRIK